MLKTFFICIFFCASIYAMQDDEMTGIMADDFSDFPLPAESPETELMDEVSTMISENDGEALLAGLAIKELVENGADINAMEVDGSYPLGITARYSEADKVKFLIELKADVNPAHSPTPLMYAIAGHQAAVVNVLLKHEAQVTFEDQLFWWQHNAACQKEDCDIKTLCEDLAVSDLAEHIKELEI